PLAAPAAIEHLDNDPVHSAMLDVANDLRYESALADGLLNSLQRYEGAGDARDTEWALIHARALRADADLLRDQTGRTAAAGAALRDALANDPRDFEGAAAAPATFATRVATTGFSADELSVFQELGLSAAQVSAARSQIAGLSPFTFSRTAIVAGLNDLITADE